MIVLLRRLLAFGFVLSGLSLSSIAQTPAQIPPSRLIVPGQSIGSLRLGLEPGIYNGREPDGGDAAMGGKYCDLWYLGTPPGDKGRPFHRPDEIGTFSLRDMEHDSADHPGKVTTTAVYVTSPRFTTADGIGPGCSLANILEKYPNAHTGSHDPAYWPLYEHMEFYEDWKDGIGFAIQKSTGLCVQVCVVPVGGPRWFSWSPPLASSDYYIGTSYDESDYLKLGMTSAEVIALIGKPVQKPKMASYDEGAWWRWRLPPQASDEAPGLAIYMRKLSDGTLYAFQIRYSSPAFIVIDSVFPGCPLKDAQADTRSVKIKSDPYNHTDIYGDLNQGLLFEVRPSDSICTAIDLVKPPVDFTLPRSP
jgi:hypothetical protein